MSRERFAFFIEARSVVNAIREEMGRGPAGRVVVSGMLAEQLARELAVEAEPGAVAVGDASRLGGAEVVVHVLAGDPGPDDEALVRAGDRVGVPTVLVQLWPQADWKPTFVLAPFVVECRAGEGFPVPEIAARVADAAQEPPSLAARIPVLRQAVAASVVRETAVRAGLIGAAGRRMGSSRPLLALEQVRMIARLGALGGAPENGWHPLAGLAGSVVALGFVLREAAGMVRRSLPAPVANAAVAAAGTWALGAAARQLLEARTGPS